MVESSAPGVSRGTSLCKAVESLFFSLEDADWKKKSLDPEMEGASAGIFVLSQVVNFGGEVANVM